MLEIRISTYEFWMGTNIQFTAKDHISYVLLTWLYNLKYRIWNLSWLSVDEILDWDLDLELMLE